MSDGTREHGCGSRDLADSTGGGAEGGGGGGEDESQAYEQGGGRAMVVGRDAPTGGNMRRTLRPHSENVPVSISWALNQSFDFGALQIVGDKAFQLVRGRDIALVLLLRGFTLGAQYKVEVSLGAWVETYSITHAPEGDSDASDKQALVATVPAVFEARLRLHVLVHNDFPGLGEDETLHARLDVGLDVLDPS